MASASATAPEAEGFLRICLETLFLRRIFFLGQGSFGFVFLFFYMWLGMMQKASKRVRDGPSQS